MSYGQLTEENQKCWRTLGVFPASFDASAAGAMWNLDEEETLRLLGLLRRYSLLDYDETALRYSLHDLLAEYACSKMDDEEEVLARISHSSYYSEVLGEIGRIYRLGGKNILPALRLYDMEWTNIEAGQKVSVLYLENNQDAARACNWYAWQGDINELRLKAKDRIRWFTDGIRAARVMNNKEAEGAHYGNLGLAYAALGETRQAIEFYEQHLGIAREIGDRRGEGNALGNLGSAYFSLGEYTNAENYYSQQITISQEIGDKGGEANAFWGFAICKKQAGNITGAREMFQRAFEIFEQIESPSAKTMKEMLDELDEKA